MSILEEPGYFMQREKFRKHIRRELNEGYFRLKRVSQSDILRNHFANNFNDAAFPSQERMLYYFDNPIEIVSFVQAKWFLLILLDFKSLSNNAYGTQLFFQCAHIVRLNLEKAWIEKEAAFIRHLIVNNDQEEAYQLATKFTSSRILRSDFFTACFVDDQLLTHLLQEAENQLRCDLLLNLFHSASVRSLLLEKNHFFQWLEKKYEGSSEKQIQVLNMVELISEIPAHAYVLVQSNIIQRLLEHDRWNGQMLAIFGNLIKDTQIFYFQLKSVEDFFAKLVRLYESPEDQALMLKIVLSSLINAQNQKLMIATISKHVQVIENLQFSDSQSVRNLSFIILDDFFRDLFQSQ